MPREIGLLFERELHISLVSESARNNFMISMKKYLEHSRIEGAMEGRTYEYIEKHLKELVLLMDAIGLSVEERIEVLTNMPSLINTSKDMVTKYLLLGMLENDENSYRKKKLINRTNDFRIGLKKLYGRYTLAVHAGYPEINWNLLVHSTDIEFAKRFVKGAYYKPYQMFKSTDEVLAYVDKVSLDSLDIEEIMSWDVNREIVDRYGERKNRKV